MKPSSYPRGIRAEKLEPELLQGWHKKGQCPEGTIPIIRAQIHNSTRTKAFVLPRKNLDDVTFSAPKNHEVALQFLLIPFLPTLNYKPKKRK